MSKIIAVALRDVLPNPYREIDQYELDTHKLEELENSINRTGFWNNIMARETPAGIEIAYGHHRLQAAKNVLGEDYMHAFAVADIPDFKMLQMMADENKDDWGNSTKHNNLTVHQGRDYLDGLLDKYPTWEEATQASELGGPSSLNEWFGPDQQGPANYAQCFQKGVGIGVLVSFFGWKKNDVEYALRQLAPSKKQKASNMAKLRTAETKAVTGTKTQAEQAEKNKAKIQAQINRDKNYDTNAGNQFDKPVHADIFRKTVTTPSFLEAIPKNEQKALATKIIKKLGPDVTATAIETAAWAAVRKSKNIAEPSEESFEERFSQRMETTTDAVTGATSALLKLRRQIEEEGVNAVSGFKAKKLNERLEALQFQIVFFYNAFGIEPPVIEMDLKDSSVMALPSKGVA